MRLSPQHLAIPILLLAIVGFIGAITYRWYTVREETFLAGAPPQDILDAIEPRQVPYEQIKPRAITPTDAFLFGSPSSSAGVLFYGDYNDPASNAAFQDVFQKLVPFQDRVRLVWHHLPASTDDGDPSFEAAVLSECSRIINPRWPIHYLLVISEEPWKTKDLQRIAFQLSESEDELLACQRDADLRSYLRKQIQIARGDGIDTAPFVFSGTQAIPASAVSGDTVLHALDSFLP